jgi:hypothetical protein
MHARLEDVSVSNDPGYYRIDALLGGGVELNSTSLNGTGALSATDTVSFYIGGVSDAFDSSGTLQDELDLIGPRCGAAPANAINNLDILCHASTATTLTATVDIDNISGSTTTRVRTKGTSSSFVIDGTILEIQATAAIGSIFDFSSSGVFGLGFEYIKFNCNANADYATYCGTDAEGQIYFAHCESTGGVLGGHIIGGTVADDDNWKFIGCEIVNSGGWAVEGWTGSRGALCLIGCNVNDHDSGGVRFRQGKVISSRIYNITGNGIGPTEGNVYESGMLKNNTIFNCTGDGISLPVGVKDLTITGNTVSNCDGVGYNLNTNEPSRFMFYNNHSFNNFNATTPDSGDSHCNKTSTLVGFLVYDVGGNIVGDPDLDGDFIPAFDSVLVGKGVAGFTDTIGALPAEAGGGAGGGVMPFTGLLS